MNYLWIGIGAALGANGRYLVGQLVAGRQGADFPTATLIVNVSGSLLIGFLMVLLTEHFQAGAPWRLFLVVGLLGGYTTFSSFSFEVVGLIRQERLLPALAYVGLSVCLGLAACYVGMRLAQTIVR